jgi:putative ABC transport system permease protein
MLRLALKMLYGDRAKYAMLVCGLTFCSLLMTQQSSVFCGLMLLTVGTLKNIQAPVWVTDAKVEQVNETIGMRDIEVTRVRSVPGVEWAVPLYWGLVQARMANGSFQAIQLTGLDNATLVGRPAKMLAGRIEDLRLPNTVIVDQVAMKRFKAKGLDVKVGSVFEINDKEARVVGICETARSFLGQPYVYTTYDRALEYAPKTRKLLSFILVQPREDVAPEQLVESLRQLPGLTAFTHADLSERTVRWYVKNTGIPISFGTVVLLGIIVGVAVAGQTFYLFIHENLRFLAALKAMGARLPTLARMVFLQAFAVGLVGYGIGVGLAAAFGHMTQRTGEPPFFMPWQVLVFSGAVIVFICVFSALVGLIKIARAEPAAVFK